MAANSSFRCCAIVTSSDMSSEKREPSTEDSTVIHNCDRALGIVNGPVAITLVFSDRAAASDCPEDSDQISASTKVYDLGLTLQSSR